MSAKSQKRSAGILLFRKTEAGLEVLVVHPGGPFWKNKDEGAWSLPKGEYGDDEEAQSCALRELAEELGPQAPRPDPERLIDLGEVRQASGKVVRAWAAEADFDPAKLRSNSFEVRWPPRSESFQSFPEVDRAEWLDPAAAKHKLNPAQGAFLDRLVAKLG